MLAVRAACCLTRYPLPATRYPLPAYRTVGCTKLRLAVPHLGHCLGFPLGSAGSVETSRDVRSVSSDAAYASIAAIVALFLRSSNTILSNVSRLVCHVYCRYSE